MTSMAEQITDTQRTARAARLVASVLEALPAETETPTHVDVWTWQSKPGIKWLIWNGDNQRERAAAIIRAVGGHWDKRPGSLYSFTTERNGVELDITVDREAVCERVVTGTRQVIKIVPAPDAPTIEVTETVEDVEWRCAPVLTEAVPA